MSECHNILTFFFDSRFGIKYDLPLPNLKIGIMTKVNIKPLGDRVVIAPAKAEDKTASGIIIPDTAKEKPQKGTVVAVADNKENPLTVKVGNEVLYGKYAGTEITIDGEDYLIMKEEDILAVI
jgi:chaperonin GroES